MHRENLTERQKREIEYHVDHARLVERKLQISDDVVFSEKRRWWVQNWDMYTQLRNLNAPGKRILVVGCGAGEDAILLVKLGAEVFAFDLSDDMLNIARDLAQQEDVSVCFERMAAEQLTYPDSFFDVILARDILHHVDILKSMGEIARAAKNDAILVLNEVYSHSITEHIRHSWLVEHVLYKSLRKVAYDGQTIYITEDERKLNESDMSLITSRGFVRLALTHQHDH